MPVEAAWAATGPAHAVARSRVRLIDVCDVEHRLRAEQVEGGEFAPGGLVGQVEPARRPAAFQQSERRLDGGETILRLAVPAAGALNRGLPLTLQAFEVGQHELGLDQLDIAQGVERAGAVRDLVVLEAADQVEQGVDLAHVAEEAVAEPLALAGAFDEAGDVDHLQHARHDLARAREPGHRDERFVRHRRAPHVGLHGAERIVADLGRAARHQRVEERGLAHVGQPHDAASEAHATALAAARRPLAAASLPAAARGGRRGS